GTGLGLAIAQQLARAMGGHLVLSNREGGGLQATLTLPLASSAPAQPAPRH
ncbi:MAG TPA: two-component sensor histidine kinase, partial [Cupriavidus sp.]|nr:two-component sensor histidine kinase [Cupriavidus sp.]